jgi:ethanolamine ammonia-lyase large subunit
VKINRRNFVAAAAGGAAVSWGRARGWAKEAAAAEPPPGVSVGEPQDGEDLLAYIERQVGKFDLRLYAQLLGAANEFKEGDLSVGVAAANDASRWNARTLLSNTRTSDIDSHPLLEDDLYRLLRQTRDTTMAQRTASLTLGQLKQLLLTQPEASIKEICPGLSSDVIACVVKLMSDQELIAVAAKVFNPLPGSNIGARDYLGARIQPNSPTDNVDDIRWQVFNGWAYAVGDVVLGTNPVSSEPESVAAVEAALADLLAAFGLEDVLPHCVLAHIDVQAEVERANPGSTGVWFQSIAGSDAANHTFDISVQKMLAYAAQRTGKYGLYFETGQGADFTNGHSHGYDMVIHESRKYGFARALTQKVAQAQAAAGRPAAPWVHLNDVAGFIGPEVFRTREQLVRCCLEDIVMGKLHGLTIGLDICSTLHMEVSLDDLDWCIDQIMPANPAYLMALPTKIDPMLGYLTTGFQDHVRIREKFGYQVNDRMWSFFQKLGVIDNEGQPTSQFGDPAWVYLQYRRAKQDQRNDEAILAEARQQMAGVRSRGVFLAEGYGRTPGELAPALDADIRRIYRDAKTSLWTELTPAFIAGIPNALPLATKSADRSDYILHPTTGEQFGETSLDSLNALREQQAAKYDVQLVVSDGLNALAIMDEGHLAPFLTELRRRLLAGGYRVAPQRVVLTSGRVRAGYRIGETLFGDLPGRRSILHVIGERPGTGHHTFSVYITQAAGAYWAQPGQVDHNITKVVSGIALTALQPLPAAADTVRVLGTLTRVHAPQLDGGRAGP